MKKRECFLQTIIRMVILSHSESFIWQESQGFEKQILDQISKRTTLHSSESR